MSQPGSPSPARFTRFHLVLALLVLLGAVLRLHGFASVPLWEDEALTYFISGQGFKHFLWSLPRDSQPPLFYLLEAVLIRFAGHSEAVLRLPSLVAGIALIVVTGAIGAALVGEVGGLWAAALVATSPMLIGQSQNARCYSLLILALLAAAWSLWQYAKNPSRRWGMTAAGLTLVCINLNYLGLLLLPIGAGALLLHCRGRSATAWVPVLMGLAMGLALVPLVRAQVTYLVSPGRKSVPITGAVLRAVHALGPGVNLQGRLNLVLCALFVAVAAFALLRTARDPDLRKRCELPVLAAAVCLGGMFAFVLLHVWEVVDYHYALASPFLAIWLGGVATSLRVPRAGWALGVLALAPGVGGAIPQALGPPRPYSDFPALARAVAAEPADGVLLERPPVFTLYKYYERLPLPIAAARLPAHRDPLAGTWLVSGDELIRTSHSLWMVRKDQGPATHPRGIDQVLRQQGYRQTEVRHFTGLRLLRWERSRTEHAN